MGFIKAKPTVQHLVAPIQIQVPMHRVEWSKLVSLDFETFYDEDYTLSKLSTSEYIRDPRFEALMVGVKIGRRKTVVVPGPKIKAYLAKIDWKSHSLLCHNTQFDGFILSHHYKVVPKFYYCTMSMGRGLHSNEIGAGLDEVAKFYGREGKLVGGVEGMKGTRYKDLVKLGKYEAGARYCGRDVDEMYGIFEQMVAKMPDDEIGLIDLTVRMFCDPVLRVNIPRVEAELAREIAERERLFMNVVPHDLYEKPGQEKELKALLKTGAERELQGKERIMLKAKRILGSNEKFADLLRAEGVEPPVKISPAWIKKPVAERLDEDKWAYAFAKDDADFVNMPDDVEALAAGLDLNKKADVKLLVKRQERLRLLVDCRLAVKSTTNITRAQRFLTAGAGGMRLPAGYAYARAHTLRWGGINKMNLQNLMRGGELRLSIEAESPKHELVVADSGQIECVARDTLVLTKERGYVMIQDILKSDSLWDGVEWVHHDGVVCTGIKEVIAYDGVLATATHKVWKADGSACALADVSAQEDRPQLAVGSLCGQAVRFVDSSERADRRALAGDLPVLGVQPPIAGFFGRSSDQEIDSVQELRWEAVEKFARAWQTVRRDQCEVQYPAPSELLNLRRTWDQAAIFLTEGIYFLDGSQSAAQGLLERRDRPDRQQRALRTREPEALDTTRERQQSADDCVRDDERRDQVTPHVFHGVLSRLQVWLGHDWLLRAQGADRRTDHREVQGRLSETQVFDILNAGPRHRFTAAGRIVSNCRVNGWFWDQDDLLDAFRISDEWDESTQGMATGKNRDAYCKAADDVYGFEVTKANKMERFVGKVITLALSFGMSGAKLQITLARGALGGPPVFFTLDQCTKIVNTYRLKNYRIKAGWKICDRIIEDMAAGRTGSHKCISWGKDTIYLPNGLTLKYPQLKKTHNPDKGWDEWTYMSGTVRKKLYGSLLTENVIQCLARIIVGWQMLQISKKYRVVMTTHDEVVTNVLAARAAAALKFMLKWMRTPPEWCADIPLNAEGGHAPNYSK